MAQRTQQIIARQVWNTASTNQAILYLGLVIGLLIVYAAYSGWASFRQQNQLRAAYQRQARQDWLSNPDKHPHRMAHYGHFAFRPKPPLSVFDGGMESFLGSTLFLEAHKQNSVNFSEAGFSTGLLRFGEISLAMILQLLLPLVIFFLGFASVATERDNGTLKIVLSQGTSWHDLLVGKCRGLIKIMSTMFIPVMLTTVALWLAAQGGAVSSDEALRLGLLIGAYFLYLTFFCVIAVLVSAVSSSAKAALITLIGLWLMFTLVLPRATQALGAALFATPSKVAFFDQIGEDVLKEGDSHNPADPHYKALKDSLLATYHVDSVQQLPFNYSGFVMAEGEKISATLYNQHFDQLLAIYDQQNRFSRVMAFLNPYMAIRNLSMALSGTDYTSFVHFGQQAEQYRYDMAQKMNALQMQYVSNRKPSPGDPPVSIDKNTGRTSPSFATPSRASVRCWRTKPSRCWHWRFGRSSCCTLSETSQTLYTLPDMFTLAFKQFIRAGGARLGLLFLLIAGIASLLIGRQFMHRQAQAIADVQAFQQKDFVRNAAVHHDDLGLLLYYLKFSLVNETPSLAGLSIGQRDVNPSIQSVTIRALEGQKYDADLTNPANQLLGNLDFSFVLIYLFPLLIIAFTYNLISEERENGTWKLLAVQSQNVFALVLKLFAIRALILLGMLLVLLLLALPLLGIPLNTAFLLVSGTSVLYVLFWFSVSFWVASWQQSSAVNAMLLLGIWLSLVILLPAVINAYLLTRYPVPEALATMLKQRKGYHEKWDTDKQATLAKFYVHYPQFRQTPVVSMPTDWRWYYAMQQLGDDESAQESGELRTKLQQRDQASRSIAQFVPTLHTQLQLNNLARTGLGNQLRFLDYTTRFHEQIRLYFYPKIFTNAPVKAERWTAFPVKTFSDMVPVRPATVFVPLLLFTGLLATLGWITFNRTLYPRFDRQ